MVIDSFLRCGALGLCAVMMQGMAGAQKLTLVAESSSVTAGADLPEAPEMGMARRGISGVRVEYQTNLRPFSRFALAFNTGIGGFGLEGATPLSNKWNLRAGASMLTGTYTFTVSSSTAASSFGATLPGNSIGVVVQPHLKSAMVAADWFPRYGSFRVSPGLTLYNGNRQVFWPPSREGRRSMWATEPTQAILRTRSAPYCRRDWDARLPHD